MTANPFLFLFLWSVLWITELRASNGEKELNANDREFTCECMLGCFELDLQEGSNTYEKYQRKCGDDRRQWEDCSLNKQDNYDLDRISNEANGDPCRCCFDQHGSGMNQLTQTFNRKYDHCEAFSREGLEINLDLYGDGIQDNNSNNMLLFETMSNIASQSYPENSQQPSKLFNYIFNPPSFIFSQDIFTMIEAAGELKIINRSENLKLTIGEILKDTDIIRVENYTGDVLPNKEKTIRFFVVPQLAGDQQQINLFFKLSFFDTMKAKQISAKTVQYTILLQSVKENRFNITHFRVEAHQEDSQYLSTPIVVSNPTSDILQIHTASLLKKSLLISFEADSERLQSLVAQTSTQTKKWFLEPETTQQIVFLICSLSSSGALYDVLRITFIDSPLVMEIPIDVSVQSNSIAFSRNFLNMGIVSSSRGFNSRFIEIENHSSDIVEIQDITILFNKGQACVAVDGIITTQSTDKSSQPSSSTERVLVQPFEKNKIIGKLKVFYGISDLLEMTHHKIDSQENNIPRKFQGKVMVWTNITATPFEIEFSFFRDIHILDYTSLMTSFYIHPIPLLNNVTYPHTPLPKSIEIQNIFPVQQKITGLIVPTETASIFKFSEFQEKILESGESKVIVQVEELVAKPFTNDTSAGRQQQQSFVLLQINKKLEIPIFFSTFNMMISCAIDNSQFYECSEFCKKCSVHFGSKAMGEVASRILRLKNRNPEPIQISQITKLNSAVKLSILLNFEQKGFANESASKILIPEQNGSSENLTLNLGAGEEIVIEVQLDTQAPIVSNLDEAILIKTQFQDISIPLVYKVIEGEITIEAEKLVFNGTNSKLMQFVQIRNSFDVDLMVQGIRNDNPRFKIIDVKRIIQARSTEHFMTIVFNRTYDYGQNVQPDSEENFISTEDFEQANFTSHYENKYVNEGEILEQVIKPNIWIDFNVKSVKLDVTAFNQRVRLLNEKKIEFNNSEIHSFYQKTLTFSNPLEVPVLFQLFVSPDNIFTNSIDSKNSQLTSDDSFSEPEEECTFCIPMNLHKIPLIKEVYESLSDFFTNKGMEQHSEIQDQEVLKRIQTHPDFDRSQLPMLLQLIDTLQIFSASKDENEQIKQSCQSSSTPCSNPSGFFCKKGLISEKVKNYMQKIEFSQTLLEFYQSPNIQHTRMQAQIEHIKALSREIIEISSYSNARPNIFGLRTSEDKGIVEKIMNFFKNLIPFGKITSKTLRDHTLISNWQSPSIDLFSQNILIQDDLMNSYKQQYDQGLKHTLEQQVQQVYLGIDVSNRTILLQPKQTLKLNSLIFLPQYGDISGNLIVKTNASDIDVIPIRGHSGIGKLQLMEVRNLSPMMLGNTTFTISEEEKVYQENVKQQIKQGVFLFSMKAEEVELAYRHKQDILKNFVIQNNGEYSIHVKNIYFESQSCSGYGFFILGCMCTFKLEPGQEKIITIGYRSNYPHDTLSKHIYFYTSSYNFKFVIKAELSPIKQQQQQQYSHVSDNFKRSAIFLSSQMEGITERQEDSEKMLQILLENVEKATKLASNEENKQEWVWMATKPRSFDSLEKIGQNFVLIVVLVTAVFFIYTFTSFFITDVLKVGQKPTKASILAAASSQSIQILAAQQEAESKGSNSASQYCIQAFSKSHIVDNNILILRKDLLKIKEFQEQKKQEHLILQEELTKLRKLKREGKAVVTSGKEGSEIDNSQLENIQGLEGEQQHKRENEYAREKEDNLQTLKKQEDIDEEHQETEKMQSKNNNVHTKVNSRRELAKKEKQKQSQFKKVVSQQDKKSIQEYINNEKADIQNLKQISDTANNNKDCKLPEQQLQSSSQTVQSKQSSLLIVNKEEGQVAVTTKLAVQRIKEEKVKQQRKIDDSIQREIEQSIQRHHENMLRLAQQKEIEEQQKSQEIIKKAEKEERTRDGSNGSIHSTAKQQNVVGSTIQTHFNKGAAFSYPKEDDGQKNSNVDEQQLQNTWEIEQVEHVGLDTEDNYEEKQQVLQKDAPIEELETFRGTLPGFLTQTSSEMNQNELTNSMNVQAGVVEEILEDKTGDRQSQDIEFQFTERTVEETESNFIEEDEEIKYPSLQKKESNCSSSIINRSSEEDFSSGDSLSEEEIDTFRKKTDAIKPIGFNLSSLTWRAQQKQEAANNNSNNNNTNNSFNEEDSYYSGASSLRESFHNEIGVSQLAQQAQMPQTQEYQLSEFNKTQQKPHLSGFINYQSESSDDESNPIKQRRYFNLFNPSPCFYPISFLSQTLQAPTENESNQQKLTMSLGSNKKSVSNQHLVTGSQIQSEITNMQTSQGQQQLPENVQASSSVPSPNPFSYITSPSPSQSHSEIGIQQDGFPSLSFPLQNLPGNSTGAFAYVPSSNYPQNSSSSQMNSQEDKQLSEKLNLIKRAMSSSSPSTSQFIPHLGPPPGMGVIPRTQQQQQFHQGNSTESTINLVKQSSNKQQKR